MILRVTDETFKYFSYHYPHVNKQDLELILKRCKPFEESDYERSLIPFAEDYLPLINIRTSHQFFVPKDLSEEFNVPSVIGLKPDDDGVIYWIKE